MIDSKSEISKLIIDYKKHIAATHLEDEKYKWELLSQYKGRPNLDADNLLNEIKSIAYGNLIYALGKAVIYNLVENKPDEMRVLFKMLFDENKSLKERVASFNSESLVIYRSLGETMQHHQDERTIATYLTFYNPEKYTFYKYSFYKKLCTLLGINEAKKNEKYPHYLELINQIIEDYIEKDTELIEQVKSFIPEYYDGTNHLLLVQDILYQMLDKEGDINYWVFQGNPKIYNVQESLKANDLTTWLVNAHKEKIKKGDKFILWVSGNKSGCYALGTVMSDVGLYKEGENEHKYYFSVSENEEKDRVLVEIDYNFCESPILWEDIKEDESFANFNGGNQGTNFTATEQEYQSLLDINSSGLDNVYQEVKRVFDRDKLYDFLAFLRSFVRENGIAFDDDRISFNVRKNINRLVFIVGNRYVFSIGKIKKKTIFSFISSEVLTVRHGSFTNSKKEIEAHWNEVEDITTFSEQIKDAILIELSRNNKSPFRKYTNKDFISDIYQINLPMESPIISNYTAPLNQILYGPPGTGKTYNTVLESAKIITGSKTISYEEALRVFNINLGNQIEFITFHQNYSYEDFIQGLRPDTENGSALNFEKKDGVFKRIADRALKNLLASKNPATAKKEFDLVFQELLKPLNEGDVEELEIKMKKSSFFITEVGEKSIEFRKNIGDSNHTLSINTLRKMYENGVNDLILGGLQPYYNPILELLLENGKSNVQSVKQENYVIIIDEINRANISRVFGELITLIEEDKRSHGKIPMRVTLPSGDSFIVPSNLYIIGTMNTADKSIALLDIALRRRFEFVPMYPNTKIEGINSPTVLETINSEIIKRKGHDFTIGHAYFMGEGFVLEKTINNKVIPLLLEYFMNDEKEVATILRAANIELEGWPLKMKTT